MAYLGAKLPKLRTKLRRHKLVVWNRLSPAAWRQFTPKASARLRLCPQIPNIQQIRSERGPTASDVEVFFGDASLRTRSLGSLPRATPKLLARVLFVRQWRCVYY